jgi:hypothetical protein
VTMTERRMVTRQFIGIKVGESLRRIYSSYGRQEIAVAPQRIARNKAPGCAPGWDESESIFLDGPKSPIKKRTIVYDAFGKT